MDLSDLYTYRYAFLKVSALAQRQSLSAEEAFPKLLNEPIELGLFLQISAYVWVGDRLTNEVHAGESRFDPCQADLLRADWVDREISVSVIGDPAHETRHDDRILLGFVSQQIGQILTTQRVRSVNSQLWDDLQQMNEALSRLKNFSSPSLKAPSVAIRRSNSARMSRAFPRQQSASRTSSLQRG